MKPVVLLSLLRRRDGLSAWVSDAAVDGREPVLRRIALNELPAGLYPLRDALLADWHSLATARELAPAWPAFWRVFWQTLTDARDQAPLAMPQRVAPVPPPTASAAHPRAFRGTRFQPPKPAAPLLDLCAWLADDRLLDGFFARHDFTRLPALTADGQRLSALPKPDQPVTVAVLLAHGSRVGPGQSPLLPQAFRRALLWHLQARPQSELLTWLRIWRGFGSPEHGRELALLARFCALAPAGHDWASLALNLSPPRQSIFVTTLLTQRAHLLPYGALSLSQLTELDGLNADDQRFACYLTAVLSNLHREVSAAYSLCGCVLGNRVTNRHRMENLGFALMVSKDCARVPMADIDRMRAAVGADGEHWELSVWENCGKLPGFDTVLRDTCWDKLSCDVADQWLATFTQMVWDDEPEEKIQRNWRAHLACFPEWHRGLLTLSSARQGKYVQMLRNHAYDWDDSDRLSKSVPYLLPLQLRLCSPPFSETVEGQSAFSAMAKNLSLEGWGQLAATNDRTWLVVERACRRDNDATLISRGLYSLTLCWPDFTLRSFAAATNRLMRTARLLGCLSYERRRQFLAETAHAV